MATEMGVEDGGTLGKVQGMMVLHPHRPFSSSSLQCQMRTRAVWRVLLTLPDCPSIATWSPDSCLLEVTVLCAPAPSVVALISVSPQVTLIGSSPIWPLGCLANVHILHLSIHLGSVSALSRQDHCLIVGPVSLVPEWCLAFIPASPSA